MDRFKFFLNRYKKEAIIGVVLVVFMIGGMGIYFFYGQKQTDKILKDEKKFVGIYPEAALWPYYTKIRKFKPGAFHFAVKDDVPIIPVVINFRAPRGIQKWFNMKVRYVTVHIGKPIYANKDLPFNESVAELMERSHTIMVRMNHWFKVIDEEKVQAEDGLRR